MDVLGSLSLIGPHGLRGRKATLNDPLSELRSCVKVEVAALGSPSLIVRTVSVDVKRTMNPPYKATDDLFSVLSRETFECSHQCVSPL